MPPDRLRRDSRGRQIDRSVEGRHRSGRGKGPFGPFLRPSLRTGRSALLTRWDAYWASGGHLPHGWGRGGTVRRVRGVRQSSHSAGMTDGTCHADPR